MYRPTRKRIARLCEQTAVMCEIFPIPDRARSGAPGSPSPSRFAAGIAAVLIPALIAVSSIAFAQEPDLSSASGTAAPQFTFAPSNGSDQISGGRLTLAFGALPPRALCRNAHWQWEDLSQQWFAGADCTDAQLQSARLIGTNFRGAILNGAQMQDAMMWYVDLDSARLLKANLRHADLAKAKLRRANLEQSDLRRAIFKHADLTGANLLGAKMSQADFTGANLQNAILTGLVMDNVNLTGANLAGADLSRADLRYAIGLTADQLKLANTDGTLTPDGLAATSESH
jgi:uncharacterized protein YjbI with pentapeptide repeats